MYPKADIPAFQLSLDERRSFKEHLELGREIRALREQGVLILGSGNIVHNLRRIDWNEPHGAYDWAVEFDAKVKSAVDAHDANALASPQKWGEALLATAHPSVEHYLPLLYCMGSTDEKDDVSYPYEGFDFGSISMRAILFGAAANDPEIGRPYRPLDATCYILIQCFLRKNTLSAGASANRESRVSRRSIYGSATCGL